MISICIPCYNNNPEVLIEELLHQYETDFYSEIIIYDDCSTIPINLRFTDNRITIVRGAKNVGSLESRRKLASRVLTSHILFLDADLKLGSSQFLKNYAFHLNSEYDIIHSPVKYSKNPPETDRILRWKYGRRREQRTTTDVINNYELFVSASFLVRKNLFLELTNNLIFSGYGSDNLLTSLFKFHKIKTLFIKNPVIHLGLDTNKKFFEKSLISVETTYQNEKAGLIQHDHRPIQIAYQRLRKLGSVNLYIRIVGLIKNRLIRNVLSSNPSILNLDILKLNHYCCLKNE